MTRLLIEAEIQTTDCVTEYLEIDDMTLGEFDLLSESEREDLIKEESFEIGLDGELLGYTIEGEEEDD